MRIVIDKNLLIYFIIKTQKPRPLLYDKPIIYIDILAKRDHMDAASKKPATKKAAKKTQVGFEESLWDAANKLRGSVESAEYKHIVLSLIFLKFISDKFEARKKAIIAEYGDEYIDMVDFYAMDNVFYLPEDARWSYIQANAKQGDIAVKIDTALHAVEKNNKSLAGALPDNYFSRLGLDASKLSALIDTINNIDTIANQNEKTEEDLVGRVYEYFLGKFAASEGKGGGEFYIMSSSNLSCECHLSLAA